MFHDVGIFAVCWQPVFSRILEWKMGKRKMEKANTRVAFPFRRMFVILLIFTFHCAKWDTEPGRGMQNAECKMQTKDEGRRTQTPARKDEGRRMTLSVNTTKMRQSLQIYLHIQQCVFYFITALRTKESHTRIDFINISCCLNREPS